MTPSQPRLGSSSERSEAIHLKATGPEGAEAPEEKSTLFSAWPLLSLSAVPRDAFNTHGSSHE